MNQSTWERLEEDKKAAAEAEKRYESQRSKYVSRLTPTQQRLMDQWSNEPPHELTDEEYQQRRVAFGLERDDSFADQHPWLATFAVIIIVLSALASAFAIGFGV